MVVVVVVANGKVARTEMTHKPVVTNINSNRNIVGNSRGGVKNYKFHGLSSGSRGSGGGPSFSSKSCEVVKRFLLCK